MLLNISTFKIPSECQIFAGISVPKDVVDDWPYVLESLSRQCWFRSLGFFEDLDTADWFSGYLNILTSKYQQNTILVYNLWKFQSTQILILKVSISLLKFTVESNSSEENRITTLNPVFAGSQVLATLQHVTPAGIAVKEREHHSLIPPFKVCVNRK